MLQIIDGDTFDARLADGRIERVRSRADRRRAHGCVQPVRGQADHALLAVRAALLQQTASEVARDKPDWPRFRVGVNSGEVAVGVVGERGHRKHDVIGDTVNLAARLEGQAPVGEVVIGEGTYRRLPDSVPVEPLPPLRVKGKAEPVRAYVVRDLPA